MNDNSSALPPNAFFERLIRFTLPVPQLSLASRVAARRICERSPYGNRCAFYACVSFSQKIFCFAKSFLGALEREVSAKQTEGVLLFTRPVPSRIQCRMDIYCRIRAAYGAYPGEKRVIGRSVEGRALFAFRAGEGRPLGIAVYAVHAREWVTALLALRHIRRSVPAGSVWFVPLLDPDGALLVQRGIGSIRSPRRREALLSLNSGDDFSLWKANAEGTDLSTLR